MPVSRLAAQWCKLQSLIWFWTSRLLQFLVKVWIQAQSRSGTVDTTSLLESNVFNWLKAKPKCHKSKRLYIKVTSKLLSIVCCFILIIIIFFFKFKLKACWRESQCWRRWFYSNGKDQNVVVKNINKQRFE